jgi:hypothetical protein
MSPHNAEQAPPIPYATGATMWTHHEQRGLWSRPYEGGVLLVDDEVGWLPSEYEDLLQLAIQGDQGAVLIPPCYREWSIEITAHTPAHTMAEQATKRALDRGAGSPHLECTHLHTS